MNPSLKKKLDLIPLIILIMSACYLLWVRIDGQVLMQWKHVAGFVALIITSIMFLKAHKIGVIALGITLILGLIGLLSFNPSIMTFTLGKTIGASQIPLLYFQPIFLAWIVLHFIFSGRYYTGILTKKYWDNIGSDEVYKIK